MNNKNYQEKTIFSIEYAEVLEAEEGVLTWKQDKNVDLDESVITKLLDIACKNLTGRLSSAYKDTISYYITPRLSVEDKKVGLCLKIKYLPGSDMGMDVDAIIEHSQRTVVDVFKTVNKIAVDAGGQVYKKKIVVGKQADIEKLNSDYVCVSSDMDKELVENIISNVLVKSRNDKKYVFNVDGEDIDFNLVKNDNSAVIKDSTKFETVKVLCVDDKSSKVKIFYMHDKKTKDYYFEVSFRDDLLTAQLYRYLLEVEIQPNEKMIFGEWVEDGGTVIGLKKLEEAKLI